MGVGASLRRNSGLPLYAGGTDVALGNPVVVTGPWQVTTVQGPTEGPVIGIANASAVAKDPVDVRDLSAGDIVRAVAAATISAGNLVGFATNATAAGASGTIQVTGLGPITRGATNALANWTYGEALESAAIGNTFAYRINPRQLAGLS